jgi:excisionase family DNA binding protein
MSEFRNEYLSVSGAIQFTGLSRPTLYKLMAADLPFYKVGTRTLIKRDDLIEAIEGRKPIAEVVA